MFFSMRNSWFEDLFGFREMTGSSDKFAATKAQFQLDGTRLVSKANGREFEAGKFETPTLGELRHQGERNLGEAKAKLPGKLRIKEAVTDVSVLHIQRENQHAVIQAASQFNCLEFPSTRGEPEDGISCYSNDMTQGPACATSCAPGTVVRNYFGLDGSGQSADKQVECLRECEELVENAKKGYWQVVNGYTLSNDYKLEQLSKVLNQSEEFRDRFRERLRIGVQWDTEVTGSKFGHRPYKGPQQLVTQAYCSACSVSYSSGSEENWYALASLVLEASYEATMYVALQNALNHKGEEGSKKVFLSAIGGGVFGNDVDWIAEAMARAFEPFREVDLEVIIVSFGRSEPAFHHLLTGSTMEVE